MNHYSLYGFHVATRLSLVAGSANPDESPDLELRFAGHRKISNDDPEGVVLAINPRSAENSGNILVRDGDRYVFRFPGFAEFAWSGGQVDCWLTPGLEEEWASLFSVGAFLSVYALVNGKTPFHASVVCHEGKAYAFLGGSGSGKTTLSAAACVAGCELLSDDVLITAAHGTDVRYAFAGGLEQRVRPEAYQVMAYLHHLPIRKTADGRCGLRPAARTIPLPLAAIIAPMVSDQEESWSKNRITGVAAIQRLMAHLQVPWLRDVELQRNALSAARELLRCVPSVEIKIARDLNRGLDFPELIHQIIKQLD